MLWLERWALAVGGIVTVITFGPPALSTGLSMLGSLVLVVVAVRITGRLAVGEPATADEVRQRRLLTAVSGALGLAVALALVAVAQEDVVLGLVAGMLRWVALLVLLGVMAHLVDEPRVAAGAWHNALLVGLCTWLPLLGMLGSAAWHIGTGRSDAAAFSVEGAAAVLVSVAAIAPLLALVVGRSPLEDARVPAVQR